MNYVVLPVPLKLFHFLSSLKNPDSYCSFIWHEFDGKTVNKSAIEYFIDTEATKLLRKFCPKKPLFEFFYIQSKTKTNCELIRCFLSHNSFVLLVFLAFT